jgi:hypothetical protein
MDIKQFNPSETIKLPSSMLILGKTGSGKTLQLHDIIYKLRKQISSIYLFSKTAKINREEYYYVPDNNVFGFLDLEVITKITEHQKSLPVKKEKLPHVIIILDDIISDPNIKSPLIRDLYTMYRHYNITTIFLSQTYVQTGGLGTIIRDNTRLCISFFQHNEKKRISFVGEYLSICSAKEGEALYKDITSEPFCSVVINCINTSARRYDDNYVFKYKLNLDKKIPKFYIGNKNDKQNFKNFNFKSQEERIAHLLL